MSRDLNPLSHLVLALVGRGGASAHDLVDMLRRGGRLFWTGAESKVYAEPKRLAALGYLAAEMAPGRTRPKAVYRLTDRGEAALREWIARPSAFPRIQHEAVVRLLAADLADDAAVRASLVALRDELAQLETWLVESHRRADELPHRARYLHLIHGLGDRLVRAHGEWLDDVERVLAAETPPREAIRP
jgi:PadR family transcriptional regulator, regulatory protein AphA